MSHESSQRPGTARGGLNRVVGNDRKIEFLLPDGWTRPSGYSQGVLARGRYVFVAGQVGWDPITGRFRSDSFTSQVRQTLRNIVTVLRKAGAGPQHLVRLTWFITNAGEYRKCRQAVGDAYAEIIGRHYPAMSIIVVHKLLPKGAKVEIEATAVIPDSE